MNVLLGLSVDFFEYGTRLFSSNFLCYHLLKTARHVTNVGVNDGCMSFDRREAFGTRS